MSLNIDFAGNRFHVDMSTSEFSNCHVFSLTTMQILLAKYSANVSPSISPWVDQLRAANPNNPNALRDLYTAIYSSGRMQPLHQNNCAAAPPVSLILFFDLTPHNPRLQHSMLIKDIDEWIGANNIDSLYINGQDYSPLGSTVPDTNVWCFPSMSQRIHVHRQQGGWQGNDMADVFSGGNHSHNLFYIQIL